MNRNYKIKEMYLVKSKYCNFQTFILLCFRVRSQRVYPKLASLVWFWKCIISTTCLKQILGTFSSASKIQSLDRCQTCC